MGEQLDLFSRRPAALSPSMATSEHAPAEQPAQVDPRQMDMFDDRWLRAVTAQKALEAFDLPAAAVALRETVKRYPGDEALKQRADLVGKLRTALTRAKRKTNSELSALGEIEGKVPAFLAAFWHRRLAVGMEGEGGAGAVFKGVPAGFHWLRAGDAVKAEQSLRATLLNDAGNSRARGYLGDSLVAQNRATLGRNEYRDAFASRPGDVDLASMIDRDVRDLVTIAEVEYEVAGLPVEWVAATGLLEGVFIPPHDPPSDWLDAERLGGVAAGVQFYRWLVQEIASRSDTDRVRCRRAMKALCPQMLKVLLERSR